MSRMPITRIKIFAAKLLYFLLSPIFPKTPFVIKRRGVRYEVDLREGIDFSVFLFGGFQSHILSSPLLKFPEGAVIFDVGANVGVMALNFAKKAGDRCRVFAFEPTDYAYRKLCRNLELNPELKRRITTFRAFVAPPDTEVPKEAYSSWRLDRKFANEHPTHGGSLQSITTREIISLDGFSEKLDIQRPSLIKIDTDGHEWDVLMSATGILEAHSPIIIFECGHYLLKERKLTTDDFFDFFEKHGYDIFHSGKKRMISRIGLRTIVPENGTIDLFAIKRCA